MTAPPIPMTYQGAGVFHTLPRFVPLAAEHYGQGEVVNLAPVEERSRKSHDHYFAALTELWATLPEHLADRYANAETFRKAGLIATGHCSTDQTVCASNAEALRLRAALLRHAPESLAVIRGAVVTVYTAHSQSMKAMGREVFQRSKDDVLGWAQAQVGADAARAA